MQLETFRFGSVEINEQCIVAFDNGLPGLEEYKRYVVLQFDDSYPILWLQSIDDKNICIPVLDTYFVFKGYSFEIEDADVEELGIESASDLHITNVLVIPDNLEQMTINLAAPIIINSKKNIGKQIILGGNDYSTRSPVFAEIFKVLKEGETDDAGAVEEDK